MTRDRKLAAGAARQQRRGWTLVELLIVCTVTGVLSVTGVVTIGMLMSAEGRGAEALVQQTTISRLSAHIREDVHAATNATVEDIDRAEQGRLVLPQIDGATITYEVVDGGLDRHVSAGEGARVGRQERFRLPGNGLHFEPVNEGDLVRLVIESPRQVLSETAAGDLPPPESIRFAVEAALGWDLRNTPAVPTTGGTEE